MAGSGGEEGVSIKFERMLHTSVLRMGLGFLLLTLVAEIDFRSAGVFPRSLRCSPQNARGLRSGCHRDNSHQSGWGTGKRLSRRDHGVYRAIAMQLLYFACREIFAKD